MSFEAPRPQRPEGDVGEVRIELPVPGQVDEAWCDIFKNAYGDGSKRTTVYADFCFVQKLDPNCYPPTGRRDYQTVDLGIWGDNIIDGVVMGAQMIPGWSHSSDFESDYESYLILEDVKNSAPDEGRLVQLPGQRVLVPMSDIGGKITLYY